MIPEPDNKNTSLPVSCLSVNSLQPYSGLAPQTHDGKGKIKDIFVFVLFVKALGYFLLPSSSLNKSLQLLMAS